MWSTLHMAVLLFLPIARSLPKKPEEERKEEWSVQDQILCTDCRTESQKGSAENSPVERQIIDKKTRLRRKNKHHLSELLQDCDWFTQFKNCSRLHRKLVKAEIQQKNKQKTECGTIDTKSFICCKDKLYKKRYGKSTSCCGRHMYDSSRNKCCMDTVKDKHNGNCCKSLMVDTKCYSCKHGIITAQFDVDTSICCEGVIYNVEDDVHKGYIDCANHHFTLSSTSNQSTRGQNKEFLLTTVSTGKSDLQSFVNSETDLKEQSKNEEVPDTAQINTGLKSSVVQIAISVVVSLIGIVVVVALFIYKGKAKIHKAAGNHTKSNVEPGSITSKGNSLSNIGSHQSVACLKIDRISDFPDGEVLEENISCLTGCETFNRDNYPRSSKCKRDKSSLFSQNILALNSSKDRTQGTIHEQTEMLDTFREDNISQATGDELNDTIVKSDIEKETMFVKTCNDRYSFSSVKSNISIVLSECQSEGHMSDFTDEECQPANNTHFEQGDHFNDLHHREIACNENNVSGGLAKDVFIDSRNLTASIWREIGSQTMQDNNTKKLNIFGEDWTLHGTFDATGGLLRGEKTSVELIISQGLFDVFSTSEVYGSVYTKIGALRRKFDLSENEEIVGPGVEFWFPSGPKFNKYAIIKIPYFGDDDISVYWFPSDSGSTEKLTLQRIEPKSKYNNANQDMYYQIGGDGFVYIYTKHFSGFLCTRCTCDRCPKAKKRELTLYGVVFGSYKCIDEGRQVRVRLYIADGKAKLDAFLQEYVRQEASKGREHIETTEIGFVPDVLESDDILSMRLEVMDDEHGHWINKKKRSGQPLKPDVQRLQLSKIVRCCRQDDYPAFVEWLLENDNSGAKRNFQCFIDIDVTVTNNKHVPTSDSISACNTIIIEGLRMQMMNEEEELKQCEKVRGILARLIDLETADMFLRELGVDASIKFDRERGSHGQLQTLLLRWQNKYGPGLFLAKIESSIRKLNIPGILEEIGSCYLHSCVSGKADCSSIVSSQAVLMESGGGCGGDEKYARAELSFEYPSSVGPPHIPIQATAWEHDPVRGPGSSYETN
ncbi:hypothetical protein CHS0354_012239 [Potamilus streckersoni]|uniref:Uncharacterized protein n=1 Tax=Potamilus streckersoni TaxID=2493646 RepID=A0AAE0SAB1_9BIVA|nr:hypothetical protein CHS0354_012239 [Potamilus streckersoni]